MPEQRKLENGCFSAKFKKVVSIVLYGPVIIQSIAGKPVRISCDIIILDICDDAGPMAHHFFSLTLRGISLLLCTKRTAVNDGV